jgi:hypothetical protein
MKWSGPSDLDLARLETGWDAFIRRQATPLRLGPTIHWAATRLAVAIVAAAFALGLAAGAGPSVFGMPVAALGGLAVIFCGLV